MNIVTCEPAECPRMDGCAVTVGIFDGVHIGHRLLLTETVQRARVRGARAVVVTFDTHPGELLAGAGPPELTSLDERLALISELGIDATVVMPFDEALRRTPARDFVRDTLAGTLGAKVLVASSISAIGAGRGGTVPVLRLLTREFEIEFYVVPAVTIGGMTVSSTAIRDCFRTGRLVLADRMLGRPVSVSGRIADRTDGPGGTRGVVVEFPPESAKPAPGQYAVLLQTRQDAVWALAVFGPAASAGAHRASRAAVFPAEADASLPVGAVKVEFVAAAGELEGSAAGMSGQAAEALLELRRLLAE